MITAFNNHVWPWISIVTTTRPLKTTPESQKDAEYHAKCARYYMSQQDIGYRRWYEDWYRAALRYAIDSEDAWGEEDDIRMFLGSEESPTGRVALKWPLVRPTLTRMTGAVDNISITPQASSATPHFAKNRKEQALGIALLKSQAAQSGPMMAGAMATQGISPSEEEVMDSHENFYVDELVKGISNMLNVLALKSDMDGQKRKTAEMMALSGLAAVHASIHGDDIIWEWCDPAEIGWDTSSIKPNMTDGEYMFVFPQMSVEAIAERWNPAKEKIEALDRFSSNAINQNGDYRQGWPQRRPRVPTVYWKDLKYVKRGYVMKDGEVFYTSIDEIDPDTGKVRYTKSDLVTPPVNRWTLRWTDQEKDDGYQTRAIQVLRYCSFIPWEYFPCGLTSTHGYNERDKSSRARELGISGDLILDYGIYPLQESDPDQVYSVEFPIKISCWSYLSGFVISPIAAALSPQRVMNQVTTDLMWRMSKGGNRGIAFDYDAAIGGSMTEEEVIKAIKNGDPVSLKGAINGGVQNSIKEYNASVGSEFYSMFNTMEQMSNIAQASTGVYDQNFGAPGSPDQLVGVKQLQLQQAGIMQQPFYAAIADLYRQMHQFNAQAGKEHYARLPWLLAEMVGQTEAVAIEMSKDMILEQFRVKVDLAPDGEVTRNYVDTQMIPSYIQLGLLDQATAASLLGRSTPSDVNAAARSYTKMAKVAAAKMEQEKAKMAQQAALAQQDAVLGQREHEMSMKMADLAQQSDKTNKDAQMPLIAAAAKAQVEQPTL